MEDDSEKQIQILLARMTDIVNQINAIACRESIDRVEFMGGFLHFCTDGTPAVGGPIFNTEWWSASSFDCWPTDEQRTWMYGPNRDEWPSTDYDD
jgi:hypothetical protein